jgi:hypothetical protein
MGSFYSFYSIEETLINNNLLKTLYQNNNKKLKLIYSDTDMHLSRLKFTLYHDLDIRKQLLDAANEGYMSMTIKKIYVEDTSTLNKIKQELHEYQTFLKNKKNVDIVILCELFDLKIYKLNVYFE